MKETDKKIKAVEKILAKNKYDVKLIKKKDRYWFLMIILWTVVIILSVIGRYYIWMLIGSVLLFWSVYGLIKNKQVERRAQELSKHPNRQYLKK